MNPAFSKPSRLETYNVEFQKKSTDATIAFPGPFYPVPPGATVRVRALSTNAAVVNVAKSYEDAVAGLGEPLAAGIETIFPCTDIGNIWFKGAVADGVSISIKR